MTRAILLIALLAAAGCGSANTGPSNLPPTSVGTFTVTDLTLGTGATAANNRSATVTYTGWLYDTSKPFGKGAQFDSGTFTFTIGIGQVVRGFDQGIVGMQVGGQRRLIIPPDLAYGSSPPSNSTIPVNATLVFDITLTTLQ
jgi:FKBP-type peptidyl-prolyl cis-trans isomerase FkpA